MTEDKSGDNENDNAFDDEIQLYCHLIWQLINCRFHILKLDKTWQGGLKHWLKFPKYEGDSRMIRGCSRILWRFARPQFAISLVLTSIRVAVHQSKYK